MYDKDILIKAKYKNRPFIYIKELSIALAIPEKTNHHKYNSKYNFYFNKNRNYLDLESMIYVSKDNIWLKKHISLSYKNKLREIYLRKDEIIDMIMQIFDELKSSLYFEKGHMHILRSKYLCKTK